MQFVAFFFQAEAGIRVGHVTGVQTCALPIYISPLAVIEPLDVVRGANVDVACAHIVLHVRGHGLRLGDRLGFQTVALRSEGSRVGRDGRCGGSAASPATNTPTQSSKNYIEAE